MALNICKFKEGWYYCLPNACRMFTLKSREGKHVVLKESTPYRLNKETIEFDVKYVDRGYGPEEYARIFHHGEFYEFSAHRAFGKGITLQEFAKTHPWLGTAEDIEARLDFHDVGDGVEMATIVAK